MRCTILREQEVEVEVSLRLKATARVLYVAVPLNPA
jgi:hypothetical protein